MVKVGLCSGMVVAWGEFGEEKDGALGGAGVEGEVAVEGRGGVLNPIAGGESPGEGAVLQAVVADGEEGGTVALVPEGTRLEEEAAARGEAGEEGVEGGEGVRFGAEDAKAIAEEQNEVEGGFGREVGEGGEKVIRGQGGIGAVLAKSVAVFDATGLEVLVKRAEESEVAAGATPDIEDAGPGGKAQ
jgi:hypothetical protein